MFPALGPYLGLAKALAVIVVVLSIFGYGYHTGSKHTQGRWDAEKAAQVLAAAERHAREEADLAGVGVAFAEQAQKQRVITQVITKEVSRYVPNTLPMLPADFRLYYDAAVSGREVDDSGRATAAPVSPKDVAANAADNYADCRYDQSRLEALQKVVKVLNEGPAEGK